MIVRCGLVVALSVASFGSVARAASGGCEVTTIGQASGSCRYTASGPGTYEVETLSGYRIEASDDGGATFHALVSRFPQPGDPASAIAYASGPIATTAGELVQVSIDQAVYTGPNGVIRYQDGHIKAGDA